MLIDILFTDSRVNADECLKYCFGNLEYSEARQPAFKSQHCYFGFVTLAKTLDLLSLSFLTV